MFPTLCEQLGPLVPEVYFGGEEVPPYMQINLEHGAPLCEVVNSIRSIGGGENSSGYIDEDVVHFHVPNDEVIQVDLSREFVFVSQPRVNDAGLPTAWQVLSFLQEPVHRAAFIDGGTATVIEKTIRTLKLCEALDKIWARESFLQTIISIVESEEMREKGLCSLMRLYEEETDNVSSEMWEFWDSFSGFLMKRRLGLIVTEVS